MAKQLTESPKRSALTAHPVQTLTTSQRASEIHIVDVGRIAALADIESKESPILESPESPGKPILETERIAGMVDKALVQRAREIRLRHRLSDSSMIEEGLRLLFQTGTDDEVADYLRTRGHRLRRNSV